MTLSSNGPGAECEPWPPLKDGRRLAVSNSTAGQLTQFGLHLEANAKQLKKMADDRTGQKALTKLAEMKTGRVVTFPALADLPKLAVCA